MVYDQQDSRALLQSLRQRHIDAVMAGSIALACPATSALKAKLVEREKEMKDGNFAC